METLRKLLSTIYFPEMYSQLLPIDIAVVDIYHQLSDTFSCLVLLGNSVTGAALQWQTFWSLFLWNWVADICLYFVYEKALA